MSKRANQQVNIDHHPTSLAFQISKFTHYVCSKLACGHFYDGYPIGIPSLPLLMSFYGEIARIQFTRLT